MSKDKLIYPIAIVISAIIIGGSLYAIQINKQDSIERQQRIELEFKKKEVEAKTEQEQKEYIAKRKGECYEIEQKERKNWNNIEGHYYDEMRDVCEVKYKNNQYNKLVCDKIFQKSTSTLNISAFITECNKTFTKEY